MSTWVCANCGGENPEGMKFCGHCGAGACRHPPSPTTTSPMHSGASSQARSRTCSSRSAALPEERRLITALFADVSGFTALADRLDPEELLEVIDPSSPG